MLPEAYRLATPCSPHEAAARDGVVIDDAALGLPAGDGPLVVEGAGGADKTAATASTKLADKLLPARSSPSNGPVGWGVRERARGGYRERQKACERVHISCRASHSRPSPFSALLLLPAAAARTISTAKASPKWLKDKSK